MKRRWPAEAAAEMAKIIIFSTKFIIVNAEFIMFNAKFIIFDTV